MSRTYVSHFLCALVVLSLPLVAGADDNIRAQLEAGEFGPALEAAKSLPGGARDRWLGQVAAAQAAAGAVQGARSTLGSMADDSARYDAVSGIRSAPVGERWGRGGAAMADFDTLIELITSTISPESWEDVGGAGAIEEFPGGVYVDPKGLLKKRTFTDETGELKELRGAASGDSGNRNVRRESPLRKVSLNRLEKQLQLNAAFGDGTAESLEALAGIYKIQYVFVYPETGDVVIAGPAGDWKSSPEGRRVHAKTGKPTLHLDDLVVMLRAARGKDKHFGCSITPLRENLANAKRYLEESAKKSLRPGQRGKWLADLRDHMGRQKIDVFGIDARTHASHVLVEADYRMKLVGMGLEEGTLGVKSYLDAVKLDKDGNPPAMSVLRWWFTPNYSALRTTPDRNAFELRGQGVKVLSENEMLTERGERVHTGKSDELTSEFARSFTTQFGRLADKYPVYAELRNVFDLALVANLIEKEDLAAQANWNPLYFDREYSVSLASAPTEVETVINHKVLAGRHIIAGVSGGVSVQPKQLVSLIKSDDYGVMKAERSGSAPDNLKSNVWWWD